MRWNGNTEKRAKTIAYGKYVMPPYRYDRRGNREKFQGTMEKFQNREEA
jgi:hypothetical protein